MKILNLNVIQNLWMDFKLIHIWTIFISYLYINLKSNKIQQR